VSDSDGSAELVKQFRFAVAFVFLRDEERAPIEYVADAHGYRLADDTWELPPVSISRDEVFAFTVARKLLDSFRGTPLEMDMTSVLGKIADSMDGTVMLDLAYNMGNGLVATFAMSRIREVCGTRAYFEVPDSFDPARHAKESFGIVRGDKVFGVKLLFSKKVAGYIKERVWHPTQKMVLRKNGDVILSFETAGWKELVRWVLSWQPDVKVLTPKRLADRIREKMRMGLKAYVLS